MENDDLSSAKVVALGSGTKCIDAEYMNGEGAVHDTHAEIVARRSLLVYFYDQLKMLYGESDSGASILFLISNRSFHSVHFEFPFFPVR